MREKKGRDRRGGSPLVVVVVLVGLLSSLGAAEVPDYHGDIAPLLRQYCAGCHNDDDFEGEFSVERFVDLVEGAPKGKMIDAEDVEGSYLIRVMTGQTEEPMPPEDEPQLTAEEIGIFRAWMAAGGRGPVGEAEDVSILSMLKVEEEMPPAAGARAITAMAVSEDGKRLALGRYGQVTVAPLKGGKWGKARVVGKATGKVNAVHFFPGDRRRMVSAGGIAGLSGVATLWDVPSGRVLREFGEGVHRDVLYDAALSPQGQLLVTAGYDGKIVVWDVVTGEKMRVIEGHNGAIFDLAFSPDGKVLASASADETIKLWRVETGERLDTLNQPQGEQYAVVFSPDGKFVIGGGADRRIRVWRFVSTDGPRINPVRHARFAHEGEVSALEISKDGKWLVSSSADRTLKLWALPDLVEVKAWKGQPDVVSTVALMGEAALMVGRMDGSMKRLSWERGSAPIMDGAAARKAVPPPASAGAGRAMTEVGEEEGGAEMALEWPVRISGVIGEAGERDEFRFSAKAGEVVVLEVDAAQSESALDSKIEVVTAEGEPVERVRLQALRDSWFEFRGKNSMQVNDFRIFNWREMDLNEYLYCNGEVVKLWLYPRGPDSGFTVYPGFGERHTYFGTSGLTHALGEPCYVVRPLPRGTEPQPNGLPVFTVYYENDDDPQRRMGSDSYLMFTAPADGDYVARVSDVRGFGGDEFEYALTMRPLKPDFSVKVTGVKALKGARGGSKEFVVDVERRDGFDGPVWVEIEGLPAGVRATTPLVIERGQHRAMGVLSVSDEAEAKAPVKAKGSDVGGGAGQARAMARATIGGRKVVRKAEGFGDVEVMEEDVSFAVTLHADGESGKPVVKGGRLRELTIYPGETITALVKAERGGFKERIDFGKEDSGRNLAHGLIIDNIGLNGLMIPVGKTEQRFFITAAEWVPESTRTFHLRTDKAGKHATPAIRLKVRHRE